MTKREQEVIGEVVNALQVAAPLSTALRQGLGDAAQNALDIETAIERAVRAMKQLQRRER